jgi:hypothetical protein
VDESPPTLTGKPDVRGAPRLSRPSRQFEGSVVAGSSTEAKDEFLHGEVGGIARRLYGIASAEGHHERSSEGERDALQRLEVRVRGAALDPALDHPPEPSHLRELSARQTAAFSQLLHLAADPRPLLARPSVGFDGDLRSSDARHDRHMFIRRASRGLTCVPEVPATSVGTGTARDAHAVCVERGNRSVEAGAQLLDGSKRPE